MAFDRVCELFVGRFEDASSPTNGFLVDGLHFDFNVTHSSEFYKDSARFDIYNPNDETIQEIMTESVAVIFRFGYKDQAVGNIFVGQIAKSYSEWLPSGDRVIHLFCNSQRGAQYRLQRTFLSFAWKVGSSYYDILKGIADYVGVPLSGARSLKEVYIEDVPYQDSGSVRDCVENFVRRKLREIGGSVLISNNEMIYVDMGIGESSESELETTYLNFNSGLISAKSVRDETWQTSEDAFRENQAYYMGEKGAKEVKKDARGQVVEPKVDTKNVVQFTALIDPSIAVGKPVYIDARKNGTDNVTTSVVGRFYVRELQYNGSNYGTDCNVTGVAWE